MEKRTRFYLKFFIERWITMSEQSFQACSHTKTHPLNALEDLLTL